MAERIVLVSMVEFARGYWRQSFWWKGSGSSNGGWLQRECRTRRRSECDDQVSKNDFEERNDVQNAQKARLYDGKARVRRGHSLINYVCSGPCSGLRNCQTRSVAEAWCPGISDMPRVVSKGILFAQRRCRIGGHSEFTGKGHREAYSVTESLCFGEGASVFETFPAWTTVCR
jgi:hypothetical protein